MTLLGGEDQLKCLWGEYQGNSEREMLEGIETGLGTQEDKKVSILVTGGGGACQLETGQTHRDRGRPGWVERR